MGMGFSNPVTNQVVERYSSQFLRGSSTHVCGFRNGQEDAHTFAININDYGLHLVCVYDGHGGAQCSRWLEENVETYFRNFTFFHDDVYFLENSEYYEEELTKLMYQIDDDFLAMANPSGIGDGSTATMLLIQPWDLATDKAYKPEEGFIFTATHKDTIALKCVSVNVGDSRSLVIRDDPTFTPSALATKGTNVNERFVYCTEDHKPTDPEERMRIVESGGVVQNARVDGSLALSRAFGDTEYKCHNGYRSQLEIPPPIRRVCVTPTFQEHFAFFNDVILVACDGLFESTHYTPQAPLPALVTTTKNAELGHFTDAWLKSYCFDPAQVGRVLIQDSIGHGSKDNHSAIVISVGGLPDSLDAYLAQKPGGVETMQEVDGEQYKNRIDFITQLPVATLVPGPTYNETDGEFPNCWNDDWSRHGFVVTPEVINARDCLDDLVNKYNPTNPQGDLRQDPDSNANIVPPFEVIHVDDGSLAKEGAPLAPYKDLMPMVFYKKEQGGQQQQQAVPPQLLQMLLSGAFGGGQ